MVRKILYLTFFSLLLTLALAGYASAQTCSDPLDPVSEQGVCRSSCGSDEHEISGTCLGQTCCAPDDSGGGGGDSGYAGGCAGKSDGDSCTMYDGTPGECDGGYCILDLMGGGGGSSGGGGYYPPPSSGASGGGWNPGNYAMFGLPSGRIYDIIYNFLFWILALFGAFGLAGFTIAGILYLTAAGEEDQITKAKSAMKWSLVGVIVGLAGLVVMLAVDELLSGWSTRF